MCCAGLCLVAQLYLTLCNIPARLLCPWGFSKQEYWSGLPCPPPGDRPSPQIEPRLHWRQILYRLSHQGSPCMLEWVAYPFVRGSSQPRNQTISCIAGALFYQPSHWGSPMYMYRHDLFLLCVKCKIWWVLTYVYSIEIMNTTIILLFPCAYFSSIPLSPLLCQATINSLTVSVD